MKTRLETLQAMLGTNFTHRDLCAAFERDPSAVITGAHPAVEGPASTDYVLGLHGMRGQ